MGQEHPSRRQVLLQGLGALSAMVALGRRAHAAPNLPIPPSPPRLLSDPVIRLASLGESELVGGVPFAKRWFGDTFEGNAIPFHGCENCDDFPPPSESVDVAIVGGGLSGLATAYQLRDRNTVLFELRPRMGGNAMGEAYGDQSWSLASAYFMQAKRGGPLATLYDELGLPAQWRQDSGGFSFEYDGVVGSDLLGPDPSPADKRALAAYREAVLRFAGRDYPEIPFEGRANAIITELDGRSFRGDLELRCGTLPPRLAYLLQAYCYSSLGVGFDELSAAAGWNFVAAEEFGRNVLPTGNAGLAQALWNQARARVRMRAGCTVAEVRLVDGGSHVFWRMSDATRRTTFARHVVMANSKHIARHVLPWLGAVDEPKLEAMHRVPTVAYIVANVVLSRPLARDFYDLYLGGGRAFPMDDNAFEQHRVITDAVNAGFATSPSTGAITLYWPLPWHTARFSIVNEEDWRTYAELAAPQILAKLGHFGLAPRDVTQVRLSRWGHAMPFAGPGAISSGLPQELRRPIGDRLWFANQDNWLLPAVETCLTEAMWVSAAVQSALG